MPLERDSLVIAGASSLLGVELKSLLEESRFAAWDFSLLDEETAAGTLTEAAGEAAIIQPVEEGSFSRAKFVFFTGSEAFTQRNLPAARESGATVIDLSGAALSVQGAQVWFAIDGVGHSIGKGKTLYAIPSAPGLATAKLLDALGCVGLSRLALVFFRSVSEAGRPGIEELEAQTTQLLSFQSVGQPVFDTQVAFNLLDHYGAASRENLQSIRARSSRSFPCRRTQSRRAFHPGSARSGLLRLHLRRHRRAEFQTIERRPDRNVPQGRIHSRCRCILPTRQSECLRRFRRPFGAPRIRSRPTRHLVALGRCR